jgi:hypothetical protein
MTLLPPDTCALTPRHQLLRAQLPVVIHVDGKGAHERALNVAFKLQQLLQPATQVGEGLHEVREANLRSARGVDSRRSVKIATGANAACKARAGGTERSLQVDQMLIDLPR